MSDVEYREPLRVGADHPALPGHFPGAPVVPGVVLLDRVAAALQRWRGRSIAGLPQVKFLQPLLPDTDAQLVLSEEPGRVRFRIERDGATIAGGTVELAP